mmetsp:Transcript_5022/g.15760  ORF Transcript_5022/g.15760 Transcript_5022/m.15760 type:complete len:463 (-) Transcript_5022:251-1639(-)
MGTRSAVWLVSRVSESIGSSTEEVAAMVEVRSVLEEAIEDVEETFRVNEMVKLEGELDLARLEAEVARMEVSQLREKQAEASRWRRERAASARRLRDDVATDALKLRARQAEARQLEERCREFELEAKRVPVLERELAKLKRELEASKRREELSSSGQAQNEASFDNEQKKGSLLAAKPVKKGFALLDDKLLLKTFSFLTARGVLAAAQTSRVFFARVDALFGMGSSVAVAQRRRLKAQASPQKTVPAKQQPPPQQDSRQPGRSSLTAATAQAIASKLNAAEIKGIIALDERARKLELEVSALRAEKEDLKAALDSTENVKEFLAVKLRDADAKLELNASAAAEMERQRKSEHEIIAFLDARNKQLEEECANAKIRQNTVEKDLQKERDSALRAKNKLQTVYDSAIEKRDKADETNKIQRKLLVKEVKHLRSQLAAIQRVAGALRGSPPRSSSNNPRAANPF